MLNADLINELSQRIGSEKRELIEKDLILHQLLFHLSKDEFFSDNFVFKGGTCLVKCYIGYERFSEDIDFTWKDQSVFSSKSAKQTRSFISKNMNSLLELFEDISEKIGMDFKTRKSDKRYVEFGGSNRISTIKMWYNSVVTGEESFIKIQLNFIEQFFYSFNRCKLKGLFTSEISDINFKLMFNDVEDYTKEIEFQVYDIREILCEKMRAILTRRGTKARDFVDVYLIFKKFQIKPEEISVCLCGKLELATKLYRKFQVNLSTKTRFLENGELFQWGSEKEVILESIDESDFYSFVKRLEEYLSKFLKIDK
jgi:predicted nucleotidyltransferase component of viral defense system